MARIAGHCVAGGTGLAAAMGISVTIGDVKFDFTEVRSGVAPANDLRRLSSKLRTAAAFSWTSQLSAQLVETSEAREGMTAFLERRPASWVLPLQDCANSETST